MFLNSRLIFSFIFTCVFVCFCFENAKAQNTCENYFQNSVLKNEAYFHRRIDILDFSIEILKDLNQLKAAHLFSGQSSRLASFMLDSFRKSQVSLVRDLHRAKTNSEIQYLVYKQLQLLSHVKRALADHLSDQVIQDFFRSKMYAQDFELSKKIARDILSEPVSDAVLNFLIEVAERNKTSFMRILERYILISYQFEKNGVVSTDPIVMALLASLPSEDSFLPSLVRIFLNSQFLVQKRYPEVPESLEMNLIFLSMRKHIHFNENLYLEYYQILNADEFVSIREQKSDIGRELDLIFSKY